MATATLVYTTPKAHKTNAQQIAVFGTSQMYEQDAAGGYPVLDGLGLPHPGGAGTTDNTVIAGTNVQRTITYDLADPALATFVSQFPTTTAQKSALQGLWTRRLEALTGCAVTAAAVTIV
jgi:hypothetical protein